MVRPSGGVERFPPVGTAGWRRRVSLTRVVAGDVSKMRVGMVEQSFRISVCDGVRCRCEVCTNIYMNCEREDTTY